jgi:chromate reductase, NAD(P)H dehydrogenase (quinone)
MANTKILGISGSLRKNSWNTGLLRAAMTMLPNRMHLDTFDLLDIPMYNADNDGAAVPPVVRDFKAWIASSDALLIATPEYNYSVPGVLKNAIDWASRSPKDSPLTGKPVAIMGAGGVMGTVRAQLHLRQILLHNGTLILPKPEVYISRGWEKFDAEGNLIDESSKKQVQSLLEALGRWILLLNPKTQSTGE